MTGLPVVLVLRAKGIGATAAALLQGLKRHHPDVRVAGVIFNEVGGDRHRAMLAQAAARADLPVLGYLPAVDDIALPSRHLGLVQAREHEFFERYLDRLSGSLGPHLDLSALAALATAPATATDYGERLSPVPPLGQRIAIADDVAFGFSYAATLLGWRAAGAEIVPFSPLADEAPDGAADAIFLPGGYPELHAGTLAGNRAFMSGLRSAARNGVAIYGECGGYMTLGEALIDADGVRHAMAGLLPVVTSFAARKLHLGYRQGTLLADGPLGAAGQDDTGCARPSDERQARIGQDRRQERVPRAAATARHGIDRVLHEADAALQHRGGDQDQEPDPSRRQPLPGPSRRIGARRHPAMPRRGRGDVPAEMRRRQ